MTEVKDQIHAIWCVLSYLYMVHTTLATEMCSGFVLLQMYLARYWSWNRCSSMRNVAEMVRSLRIFRLFIVTDQRQFLLWWSSQNLMISSHRSMIGKRKTKRIEKLLVPPWRRNLSGRSKVTNFHLLHMCDLNVCLFFFSNWSWGLITFLAIDDDEGNHQEQVGELINQTAASIDDLALKMLFVTVQQNNLEVCIEYAINRSVVHLSAVASTYISTAGISSRMPQKWYIFTWIIKR